jgi:hypothetical protein
MQTEKDLCPGYKYNHTGNSGLCCCGLYWEGKMPPHDVHQRPIKLNRIFRRARALVESRAVRDDLRNASITQTSALDLLKKHLQSAA